MDLGLAKRSADVPHFATVTDLAELAELDAMAQAELSVRGEVTSAELWQHGVERVAALNPLLRAVVDQAAGPAAKVAGPLSGVPFLMKDSSPWPGQRWTLGSRLFSGRVTRQQTEYGRRLEAAGLICLGKAALSEFGLLASTESLLLGATLNPWDLSRSPAGSSGGSAVAVAAGLVPLAHANDGGGSIRVPAAACGVFGFKPSRGRHVVLNRSGSEFADMTSEHCITRSVRDSALFLSLTEDRTRADAIGFVRDPLSRPLRVAAFTRTLAGEEPAPPVRRAHDDVVTLLLELGHHVEIVPAPELAMPELAEACLRVAAAAVAGVVESIDNTRREPVQEQELEPFTWSLLDELNQAGVDALPSARLAFERATLAYQRATQGFDVVLTPALAIEPPPLGYLSPLRSREVLLERTSRVLGYTPIHNVAGCPAMSVPLSWSEAGLPLGAHFAAAPGRDALLLGLAYQLERARPWRDRWPPYSIPALYRARAGT